MNKLVWRETRWKYFNISVCLKSGLICSPNLENVINLMTRSCGMKRDFLLVG